MEFTTQELNIIIKEATSLYERLVLAKSTPLTVDEQNLINDNILAKWQSVIADNDAIRFSKRFSWDDIDLAQIPFLSTQFELKELPFWAKHFTRALNGIDPFRNYNANYLLKNVPIPFEEILVPFVDSALQQLLEINAKLLDHFHKNAQKNLARSLLVRLSQICSFALQQEFTAFRHVKQLQDPLEFAFTTVTESTKLYAEFVQSMLNDGLLNFFKNYPVLAKLIGTLIAFWLQNTKELLLNLQQDLEELQQQFSPAQKLGKVRKIHTNLSDPHGHGKTVFTLEFPHGTKIVYKPHNLDIDVAYFNFLQWLNEQSTLPLDFKILKIINKKTYGWEEFIENTTCQMKAEIVCYYQRVGMLLCLMWLFGSTDLHFENIIATNEYPIIIDLENLLQPEINNENVGVENELVGQTVLMTGLLPFGQNSFAKYGFEASGLTGGRIAKKVPKIHQWIHLNTDAMEYQEAAKKVNSIKSTHLPKLRNICQTPAQYVAEILDGFSKMYQFLLHNYQKLLTANPFMQLHNREARFVFRPTQIYNLCLRDSLQPEYLRNGMMHTVKLDILTKGLLFNQQKSSYWPIIKAEHAALALMDIPKFTFNTSDTALNLGNESICNFFRDSGFNSTSAKLSNLSLADLNLQLRLISHSLALRFTKPKIIRFKKPDKLPSKNYSAALFLKEAKFIADQLIAQALVKSQSATWLQAEIETQGKNYAFKKVDYDLYNGSFGIALFLAAAAKVFHNDEYRNFAMWGLNPLLKFSHTGAFKFNALSKNIGGVSGLGSIIYALTTIHNFVNEPRLIAEASHFAALITDNLIDNDKALDVMSGAAGALLALLKLFKNSNNQAHLAKAIKCGDHLLSKLVLTGTGYRAWSTLNKKTPLTGFAHGAAGIAYALLQLYDVTHEKAFLSAAEEGIAYEGSLFLSDKNNWPDFRQVNVTNCMTAWCTGATGIGLARIGALNILDAPQIREDVNAALKATLRAPNGLDHLCCGNFGRIEFLLEASHSLPNEKLLIAAKDRAISLIARAKTQNGYSFVGNVPNDIPVLGLFRGIAGVGYELLRLANYHKMSSILLLK